MHQRLEAALDMSLLYPIALNNRCSSRSDEVRSRSAFETPPTVVIDARIRPTTKDGWRKKGRPSARSGAVSRTRLKPCAFFQVSIGHSWDNVTCLDRCGNRRKALSNVGVGPRPDGDPT